MTKAIGICSSQRGRVVLRCAKAKAESGLATAATPAAVTKGDDNGAFSPVATTARPSLGMGMPCNGCGCGAMANGPNILGIMQQQQQYMLMQQQQMGMFNHMMMMGAMMGPMMGQIIAPAAPADGTSILSGVNPSTLPDPAMSLGKVVDEDDDDAWHRYSFLLLKGYVGARHFPAPFEGFT